MDTALVKDISQQVYKRFPEFKSVKPSLQKLDQNILLIYQTDVPMQDGHVIHRTVRVVAKENGDILKMSTSR